MCSFEPFLLLFQNYRYMFCGDYVAYFTVYILEEKRNERLRANLFSYVQLWFLCRQNFKQNFAIRM